MIIFIILIMSSRTPIVIIGIVLSQSILTALYIRLNAPNSWLSFVLFLVFSGGLIILFVYITRLASREVLTSPVNLSFIEIILSSLAFIVILHSLLSDNFIDKVVNLNKTQTFYKIFYLENINPILTLIIYLLVCLLIVVRLVKKDQGTLRTTTR